MPGGEIPARAKFRDFDDRVRLVSRRGRSRAAAERSLKLELSRRQAPATGGAICGNTRVGELADSWLAGAHSWSIGTERTYRSVVDKNMKPTVRRPRVQEVTAGLVTRTLRAIAERSGNARAGAGQ